AERQEIRPASRLAESLPIPREHLEVGEQIMWPEHGLRAAKVRISGYHDRRIALAQRDERFHQAGDPGAYRVAFLAQPEAHVERHLLVPAAACVDLVGKLADALLQLADDQRVHV